MKIILEGERSMGWNKFLRLHWTEKDEEVKRVNWLVYEVVGKREMIEKKVDLVITCYFKNRPQDSSNICAKLYEDGLKGIVIKDDNRNYVRSVKTVSEVDALRPRVEIDIC